MNASEFRKKAEQIFNKYNVKNSRFLDSQRSEKINTYFGDLNISAEWVPRIKLASIHSNYKGNYFDDYKQKQNETIPNHRRAVAEGKLRFPQQRRKQVRRAGDDRR